MASYTISPIWGAGAQLFDNNGIPLVGGKIYTYYAGSTTPLTTYTNPIGTVANSNPIITNSAGRLTNEIWFPVSGSYKFVLKDANDVLIATYDNIPTTPQPPIVNDSSSISYQPGYEVTAGNFTIGATYLITSVGTTDFVAIGAGANVTGILFTATGVGSGTGTAEYSRTVQNKLREIVSITDFEAIGDGVTDNTPMIQAALDTGKSVLIPDGVFFFASPILFTADDQCIFGNGNTSVLKHRGTGTAGPSWISTEGFSNISIVNLQIDAGTGATAANPGFYINSGSDNVSVNSVFFNGGNQVVWLGACTNIKVVNNTFKMNGYGVVQRVGQIANNILVDGNTCIDMVNDFVNANGESTGESENWIVSNNTYNGNANYPTLETEGRFVTITSTKGVSITGNTVVKVAGDAAIHFENTLGDTVISGNVFDNCAVAGGNDGIIWPGNNPENTIISNNVFLKTDPALGPMFAVSVANDVLINSLTLTGNLIRGPVTGSGLNGFNLGFQQNTSSITCTGNTFQKINVGISIPNTFNAVISSNSFNECYFPIECASLYGLYDFVIANNVFNDTSGPDDLYIYKTTRGIVQGNKFTKNVTLDLPTDVLVSNNLFDATASLVKTYGTNQRIINNLFESSTDFVGQYSLLGTNYTYEMSKTAGNSGGSASVTFTVTCNAAASAWSPGNIIINVAACDGIGTTYTTAWWNYKFQLLGGNTNTNEGIEDSGGTTASYAISFVNVSTSSTSVVFSVVITATGADELAANIKVLSYKGVQSIQ